MELRSIGLVGRLHGLQNYFVVQHGWKAPRLHSQQRRRGPTRTHWPETPSPLHHPDV